MNLKLHAAWSQRLKLRAESDKLRAESDKLRAESNKLWAEGNKLRAEGDKLRAEGSKLWAEAIIAAYGNITLLWTWETEHGECTLENGDRYAEDQSEEDCLGCGYACAKSAWGAWCYTCNVKRMTRINERLEPVRRAVEKQSP